MPNFVFPLSPLWPRKDDVSYWTQIQIYRFRAGGKGKAIARADADLLSFDFAALQNNECYNTRRGEHAFLSILPWNRFIGARLQSRREPKIGLFFNI